MNLKLNETLEERMERFEESNKKKLIENNQDIIYWEDIKDQYSDDDNYWDTKYSEKQIQAWRDQWKR